MALPQRFVHLSLGCVVAAALLVFSSSALAQDSEETKARQKFEDTIHVIQRKPVLEENRFELTPRFGMSVNDAVYRSFKVGTNANFHITERLYVGGLFEWFDFGSALGGRTGVFDRTYDQTQTRAEAPVVRYVGALEVGYQPIYGKFSLFNSSILYYDIGASLGGGWVNSGTILSGSSGGFGGTGSLVGRLFVNDWMAFDLELRDLIFPTTLNDQSVVANLVTVSAGMSFYFPTSSASSAPNRNEENE